MSFLPYKLLVKLLFYSFKSIEIGQFWIPEVVIVMDNQLFRGNRIVKLSNSGIKAFISPNFPILGQLEIDILLEWDLIRYPTTNDEFTVSPYLGINYQIISIYPGLSSEVFIDKFDSQGKIEKN